MKLILSLTFLFTTALSLMAQNYTIRGSIVDKSNGEPMVYEKVKLLTKDSVVVTGANTDLEGFFSISKLDKGSYILKVDNPSYQTITENIEITTFEGIKSVKYNLVKRDNVQDFETVNVSAEGKIKTTEVLISKYH